MLGCLLMIGDAEDHTIEVLSLSDALLQLMMDNGNQGGSRRPQASAPSRAGGTQLLSRSTMGILQTLGRILESDGARDWILGESRGGQTVIAGRTISWSATEMVTSSATSFGLVDLDRRSFFLQGTVLEPSHGGGDRDELLKYGIAGEGIGDVIGAFPWQEQAPELGPLVGWPKALKKVIRSCLESPVPTVLLWGEKKRVVACNERYVTTSGGKIPLGLRGMTIQNTNSSFYMPGSVRSADEEFFLIDELGSSTHSKMKAVVISVFHDSGKPGGKLVCLVEAPSAEPKSITMSVISDFGVRLLRSESSYRLWRNVLEWFRQMERYFPRPMIYLPSTAGGGEGTKLMPLDAPAVGDVVAYPPGFKIPASAKDEG
ncbi:hypothetical protein HK101_006810, partial [Irineochytrium annulatum]